MNLENKRQIVTLLLAVGLGLVAVYLVGQYVQSTIQEQTRALAAEYQQKNEAVINEVGQMKQALGEMVRRQSELDQQQQQLRQEQSQVVSADGTTQTVTPVPVFSLRTPEGKRAITVMIDSLSAVGGLVNPGDHIDIIAQLSVPKGYAPDSDKDDVTTILFQDLMVLAVGTNFDPIQTQEGYNAQQNSRSLNVTLAVDPDQTGLLTFAQTNGKLQLSLRGPDQRGVENMDVASWDTLSDYLLEKQSTEITIPKKKSSVAVSSSSTDEVKPVVQVFRGGREL